VEALMDPVLTAPDQAMNFLRQRRAELGDSMSALEHALAGPAPGRTTGWAQRVQAALAGLSDDFRAHIDVAEGPDGLHQAVLSTAPRLANAVTRLGRDHQRLRALIDGLLAEVGDLATAPAEPCADAAVDQVRQRATALLRQLVRHRQRGADLVFEAYEVDIGGEA
jgi:hypothetical protein